MNINFHGIKTEAINYRGIQIIKNSMNGGWMLFFRKGCQYEHYPPFSGTLSEMKGIIDSAYKLKKGGENYLIAENHYGGLP